MVQSQQYGPQQNVLHIHFTYTWRSIADADILFVSTIMKDNNQSI